MQIKGHVHDGTKLAYYNNEADILAGEYRQLGLELHYANGGKKNKKAKKFWKKHGGKAVGATVVPVAAGFLGEPTEFELAIFQQEAGVFGHVCRRGAN